MFCFCLWFFFPLLCGVSSPSLDFTALNYLDRRVVWSLGPISPLWHSLKDSLSRCLLHHYYALCQQLQAHPLFYLMYSCTVILPSRPHPVYRRTSQLVFAPFPDLQKIAYHSETVSGLLCPIPLETLLEIWHHDNAGKCVRLLCPGPQTTGEHRSMWEFYWSCQLKLVLGGVLSETIPSNSFYCFYSLCHCIPQL